MQATKAETIGVIKKAIEGLNPGRLVTVSAGDLAIVCEAAEAGLSGQKALPVKPEEKK